MRQKRRRASLLIGFALLMAFIPSPKAAPAPSPGSPDDPLSPTDLAVFSSVDEAATNATNPSNALNATDGDVTTAWEADGDGEWLSLDLGQITTVTSVAIAFHRGDERRYAFDLQLSLDGTSWDNGLRGAKSSGMTRRPEEFSLAAFNARYLRYLGHGNSVDRTNAITEIRPTFGSAVTVGHRDGNVAAEPTGYVRASLVSATASASATTGRPRHAIDSNLTTRWAASGRGQWLRLDLGATFAVGHVKLAIFRGQTRRAAFELQVSTDARRWTRVWSGRSAGTSEGLAVFDFRDVSARYVRYLGHDTSNRVSEFEAHVLPRTSARVQLGDDDHLNLAPYPNGDQIPDFSHAGYRGGGVALPSAPVRASLSPAAGDDGARIQAAIDTVSALPLDSNGVRGAVLLTAGTYEVAGVLTINASGVVLRGAGDGPTGTVIKAVGTTPRTMITVAGEGSRDELRRTRRTITESYAPVGSRTITLASADGLRVGDDIVVVRTPNQEWIDAIGMDACATKGTGRDTSDLDGVTCISKEAWTPDDRTMHYERRVAAIEGNRITIDAPLVEPIAAEFGGGAVYQYRFGGRIREVGIEYLRAESSFASATDEKHASQMISLTSVANAWVRNVTSVYFSLGTVFAGEGAKHITIQDSTSLAHKSLITGNRRYPFYIDDGSFILVMRCYTDTARHDFALGSNTSGPNVFLDSRGEQSFSEVGPHHRWATGTLFDNVVHRSADGRQNLGAANRGNKGTGHGWAGAYMVFYNCVADTHDVSSPPQAHNWSIGCRARSRPGGGEYTAFGGPVAPWSLYLQQLSERLGSAALTNIGY